MHCGTVHSEINFLFSFSSRTCALISTISYYSLAYCGRGIEKNENFAECTSTRERGRKSRRCISLSVSSPLRETKRYLNSFVISFTFLKLYEIYMFVRVVARMQSARYAVWVEAICQTVVSLFAPLLYSSRPACKYMCREIYFHYFFKQIKIYKSQCPNKHRLWLWLRLEQRKRTKNNECYIATTNLHI